MTSQSFSGVDLHAIYRARHGLWEGLMREVIHALEKRLEAADLKVHSVTGRVKSLKSIEGKFRRRATSNSEQSDGLSTDLGGPLQFGLKDVVGVRVVCMYLSQIDEVVKVIRESFAVLDEDRKIAGSDVASFGYMSDHFVCTLNDAFKGPRYDDVKGTGFEIQVRTIAMDAWAAVSHHLDYKSEASVPVALKKDFFALSGLFYVADTHFEMFYKQVADFRSRLESDGSLESLVSDDDLNSDTLAAYLRRRFPEREASDMETYEELLQELLNAGYRRLRDVALAISRGEPAVLQEEIDSPPADSVTGEESTYTDVGATRGAVGFADENFDRLRAGGEPSEFAQNRREAYRHLVAPPAR